jgi:hypothetical protein
LNCDGVIANFAGHFFNSIFSSADKRDPRPFGRHGQRACTSYSGAGTGDDSDFSLEAVTHNKNYLPR